MISSTSATNRQRFLLILPQEPNKPMYYGFRQIEYGLAHGGIGF